MYNEKCDIDNIVFGSNCFCRSGSENYMATDDFIKIDFDGGTKVYSCKSMEIDEWPPPEIIVIYGFICERISCSELTEEQMKTMTHVARGALYKPVPEKDLQFEKIPL